jgi:hypothetical protein
MIDRISCGRSLTETPLCEAADVDEQQLRDAFDEVFDQAIVFNGFADYMRDCDIYVCATGDSRTGIAPEHLRYRFTHCVRATVTTAVRRDLGGGARPFEEAQELADQLHGFLEPYEATLNAHRIPLAVRQTQLNARSSA